MKYPSYLFLMFYLCTANVCDETELEDPRLSVYRVWCVYEMCEERSDGRRK